MKHILTCCLIFLISSCYKVEEKTTTSSVKSPDSYRWKSLPRPFYLSSTIINEENDIKHMISAWNNPLNKTLLQAYLYTDPGSEGFKDSFTSIEEISTDKYNGFYLVHNDDWPTSKESLGVTILMGRVNNHGEFIIEEADILIRDTNYDFKTVVIHELGHYMGLQHRPERESVMFGSITSVEEKHSPTAVDLKVLARLYNLSYGVTPSSPKDLSVPEGKGQLQRVIIELSADMNCRHYLDGMEIHSHKIN